MNTNVAFIGFGELGKQMHGLISNEKSLEYVSFDDTLANDTESRRPFNEYSKDTYAEYAFYVALGYKHLGFKQSILENLAELGRNTPTYIHASCYVSASAKIHQAAFLYPMCNIDQNVSVGMGTILNNSVIISHDTVIGKTCWISPGVVFSGHVHVGDNTFIGAGSVIANEIHIGSNVIIGAGSVITKDIPDNVSVIGNPMRILDSPLKLV